MFYKLHTSKTTNKAGFSMIELLVVATIMIVLTTIGLVSYQNAGKKSRDAKRKADLQIVRQALVLSKADGNSYPAGGTPFSTVVSSLQNGGYLTSEVIIDPKSPAQNYTYSCCVNGKFTLGATLEGEAVTSYTLQSP